jgi:hypothetical protein
MTYKLTVQPEQTEPKYRRADSFMEIGDLAITESGDVFLRMYDGFVVLNNPQHTYSPGCGIHVKPLPSGTQVVLTVK